MFFSLNQKHPIENVKSKNDNHLSIEMANIEVIGAKPLQDSPIVPLFVTNKRILIYVEIYFTRTVDNCKNSDNRDEN